jgi:hypothetical protein
VNIGVGDFPLLLLSSCDFFANWFSSTHTLLKDIYEMLPAFFNFSSIWIQFGAGEVHTAVLSNCAVHENHCIEHCTFLRDENELLCILSTFIVQCGGGKSV